jgi:hypothetical protein
MNFTFPKNYKVSFAFFVVIVFLNSTVAFSQTPGCTDVMANNYNAAATVNNGSCTYNATAYTPPVKVDPLSDTLIETSGLQWANNSLWSFNDGGGAAAIYRLDTTTNAILQRVYLTNATNVDWEDIAFDGTYFYIGDFGNNANGARTDLKICKFPISVIPDFTNNPVVSIAAAQIETIHFTYANQQQPPIPVGFNSTSFDCEAMLIDGGKIHLFSKDWINLTSTHYVINSLLAGNYVATPVDTLATNYLVTAADKAPGRNIIALLGYQNTGSALHFMHLLSGYSSGRFFNGNKRRIDLPDVLTMGQAEGLTFRNNFYGYISNEKFTRSVGPFVFNIPQRLRSFEIGPLVSSARVYTFTGNGNWNNVANWESGQIPPAILPAESTIVIQPITGGKCILNIPYTLSKGILLNVTSGSELLIQGNLIQSND